MTKNKVTMKDIAKEVNVSLATVSYVLNHSEKEKISHETRLKVLEAAKRLKYVPNLTARSLANKKSNLIGIIVNLGKSNSMSKKYHYYDLVGELQTEIYKMGYDTVLSITHDLEDIELISKRSLDATFIIDMDEKLLKKITNQYYVPIIFIDCDLDEGLFYKIIPDYESIMKQAKEMLETDDVYLIMDEILNKKLKETIIDGIKEEDIYIHKNDKELKSFLEKHKNQKGIIIGDILGVQVERYVCNDNILVISSNHTSDILLSDTKRIIVSNKKKAETSVDILERLMRLDYDENGNTRVLLSPEFESL